MPRLPQYRQTEKPQLIPGVRVSPEAMTKDLGTMEGFGQAMTQAGQVGMQFATKLKEAEIESQVNLSMGLYKKGLEDFRRNHAVSKETSWSKTEKGLGEAQLKLDKDAGSILTQPSAKAAYDRQKQVFNLIYNKSLFNSTNSNRVSLILEQTRFAADLAIEQRDPVALTKGYTNAVNSDAMDKEVADAKLKLGLLEIEEKIEKDIYEAVWAKARKAPIKEAANVIIKAASLPPNQEKELLRGSNLYYADKEAKAKQDETDTADKWVTDALKKLRDKKFIFDDVLTTPKGVDREHWANILNKQNKAIKEGKVDPLTVTDPAVDDKMLKSVYSSKPPTVEEVTLLAGTGLSVKRAEHWVERIKANIETPLKADMHKRCHFGLRSLYSAGIFGTTRESNLIEYTKKSNALDDYLKTDPSPTELENYYETLIQKAKTDWLGDALNILSDPKRFQQLFPAAAAIKGVKEKIIKPEKEDTLVDLKKKFGLE